MAQCTFSALHAGERYRPFGDTVINDASGAHKCFKFATMAAGLFRNGVRMLYDPEQLVTAATLDGVVEGLLLSAATGHAG